MPCMGVCQLVCNYVIIASIQEGLVTTVCAWVDSIIVKLFVFFIN